MDACVCGDHRDSLSHGNSGTLGTVDTYCTCEDPPPPNPVSLTLCAWVFVFMQSWRAGQTSRSLQTGSPACMCGACMCVCVCLGVWWGEEVMVVVVGGAPQHFVMAHLTKQRQLTFLVLCHIWYSGTSRVCGCKDPDNTSSLPLSPALSWVLWWWRLRAEGGALSRQTLPYERKASAAANPPLLPPSTSTTPLLFFRRISQLFLDGRAKPSKDLHWRYVIKTQPSPHAVINIKIKKWSAAKMGSEWINERMNEWRLFISYWIFI